MIVGFLITFALFILSLIFGLVTGATNNPDIELGLLQAISTILNAGTQTNNFLRFIFGGFYPMAISMVTFILPLKYLIVPVLAFIRKLFVWGG